MSRGSGRTKAMLEEVLADSSARITIVALNYAQIRYMVDMFFDVLDFEGKYDPVRRTLHRNDGRTIVFVTPAVYERHQPMGTIYKDHAV